uniref:HEAT repeat domain-containing protein n=1 Tax=Tetraselmis sp. GSL018 TaxID=582737 RepID=A0A061QKS8_9CHLO
METLDSFLAHLGRTSERLSLCSTSEADHLAAELFYEYPLSYFARVLALPGIEASKLELIRRVLQQTLRTSAGKRLVLENIGIALVAVQSPEYQVRRLATEQLSAVLPQSCDEGIASALIEALADSDVGVATAAIQGLAEAARLSPEVLKLLACGPCAPKLLSMARPGSRAVERARAFALTAKLAATSPEAAAALESSDLIAPLVSELRQADDPLSCAAALEIADELISGACVPEAVRWVGRVFSPPLQELLGSEAAERAVPDLSGAQGLGEPRGPNCGVGPAC